MNILKYNTATEILFGPLVGEDGKTPYTGTVTASEVKLSKGLEASGNITYGAFGSATNAPVHMANGVYKLALTATEAMCSILVLSTVKSTAWLSHWEKFEVLTSMGYGIMRGSTSVTANVALIEGTDATTYYETQRDSIVAFVDSSDTTIKNQIIVTVNAARDSVNANIDNGVSVSGTMDSNLVAIDGMTLLSGEASLNLKHLNIITNSGSAVVIKTDEPIGGVNDTYPTIDIIRGKSNGTDGAPIGVRVSCTSNELYASAVKFSGGTGLEASDLLAKEIGATQVNTETIIADLANGVPADVTKIGGVNLASHVAGYMPIDGSTINQNIDQSEVKIDQIVAKLPAAGLIASQSDVQSIINNTTFVTTIPETALKPETGSTAYRIRALVYDAAGNMEATDNGVGIRLTSMTNANLNGRLFKDQALTVPVAAHPTYSGYGSMEVVSGETGVFEIWYKSSSTDFEGPVLVDFKYAENGQVKLHNRMTQVVSVIPGESTLSDTTANKEVIAKAIRNYIPTATLTAGSIESTIRSDISAVGVDVDSTFSKLNEVDADLADVAAEVAKIVAKLPTGGALISSLSMATATTEGTTLAESIDLVRAALRGKMTLDGNTLTFYKKDGATALFRVVVTATDRTPI